MRGEHDLDEGLDTVMPTEGGASEPSASTASRVLQGGATIGRYLVIARMGAGGMGVVYSAYDPDLDRKIALKLLRDPSHPRRALDKRLLREAQALARLNHPNVVTVHDVGEWNGQVFIAMEHVDGLTLGRWRAQRKPTWRDVLDVMLRAGAGLAAAHAAGIVHRDIKPDNIMIGNDGRVRVMDFGLARAGETTSSVGAEESASSGVLGVDMTSAGMFPGTPAYMAPEQHLGARGDTASDQFSFCVTLYELLHGERPFADGSAAEAVYNITQGVVRVPTTNVRAPAWLRRAMMRGLAREAKDRYATMNDLLVALRSDPSRRRRRVIVVTAVLGLGALGWLAREIERRSTVAHCERVASIIDETWGPAVHTDVARGFEATGRPDAGDVTQRVSTWLDPWATTWRDARRDVCTGTILDAATHDAAVECLDDRRSQLHAHVDLWRQADAALLNDAIVVAANLPTVDRCVDAQWLAKFGDAMRSGDDELRAVVRDDIARVKALHRGRRLPEAHALAQDVVERAQALGDDPLLAAAWLELGKLSGALGDADAGDRYVRRAFGLFTRLGRDDAAASAAVDLLQSYGVERMQMAEAAIWDEIAGAMLARAGDTEGTLMASYLQAAAGVHWRKRELDEARELSVRVLEIRGRTLGEHHPGFATALNSLGLIERARGEPERALEYFERALPILEAAYGPDHRDIANLLNNIGVASMNRARHDEAASTFARALKIGEAQFGPDHPDVGLALGNLGRAWLTLGRPKDAATALERALDIATRHGRSVDPDLQYALARALIDGHGDRDRALALAEKARDAYAGDEHPEVVAKHSEVVAWLEEHRGL